MRHRQRVVPPGGWSRLIALLGVALIGCSGSSESTSALTTTPTLSAMEWTLDWRLDGAAPIEGGQWMIATDLGYEVVLDKGFIVTSLVSLVPCGADTGLARVLNWVLPAAHAGHPPFDDPSLVALQAKESFTPARTATLPVTTFSPSTYCSVYWLAARGASDGDAANTSLRASGEWRRNGTTGPIAIDTNFARAMIDDLPPIDAETDAAHGVVSRSVGSLFDGIDFETDNEYAIGWGAIKNLTDQATFHWE